MLAVFAVFVELNPRTAQMRDFFFLSIKIIRKNWKLTSSNHDTDLDVVVVGRCLEIRIRFIRLITAKYHLQNAMPVPFQKKLGCLSSLFQVACGTILK